MKKFLAFMVVLAIVMSVVFAGATVGLAEGNVDWSASLSPSSLSSGGNVTFSSTIKNNTSDTITGVTITYPDGSTHQVGSGSISTGASESYTDNAYPISEEQLDKTLTFKLTYADSTSTHTLTADGKVAKKAGGGTASLTGTTSVDKNKLDKAGDKVKLTFTFKNTGNVEVTDCRLTAAPINGGKEITQKPFSLAPGASKTLNYSTALNQTTTIAPKLSYKANGSSGSVSTNTVEVTVNGGKAGVTGTVSADKTNVEPGQKVKLTFTFKNTGSAKLTDCRLSAPPVENGKEITQKPFDLNAGASKTLNYSTVVKNDMTIAPKLTYKTNGTSGACSTNTLKITTGTDPVPVPIPEGEASISLDVMPDKTEVEAGGTVEFTVTVENDGESDLTGVTVNDYKDAKISLSKTALKVGESATGKVSYTVNESTEYSFKASATDAVGTKVTDDDSCDITVTGDDILPKGLYIDVTCENQSLEEPGTVKFTIVVSNTSDVELSNVVVSEINTGEISTIPTLGTDVKTIEHTIDVQTTTNYVFSVSAKLADGTEVTATTDPVTVTVTDNGPDMLMIIIIIIIIVVVVLVIVLLVLRNKKKKQQNQGPKGGYANNMNGRSNSHQQNQNVNPNRPIRQSSQSAERYYSARAQRPQRQDYQNINEPKMQNRTQNFDLTVDDESKQNSGLNSATNIPVGVINSETEKVSPRRVLNVDADSSNDMPRTSQKKRGDRNNF